MKIYDKNEKISERTAVAIGMFDGVHMGHRVLLKEMFSVAKSENLVPVVYTFFSHPIKETKRKYLTLLPERLYLLEKFGVSNVFIAELDEKFMRMTPEEFFGTEIVARMNARAVIVGENFRFGIGRTGNVETLRKLGDKSDILIKAVPLVSISGVKVSSSAIHLLIEKGEIEKANTLLGYPFFVSGKIVQGKGIGRLLGFPTANVSYNNGYKVLPKKGVYVTYAEVSGKIYKSVTNVGLNPTFEDTKTIKIETHFLDVNTNLYGKEIVLHFLKYIRPEIKFASKTEIANRIKEDTKIAKSYFEQNPVKHNV
jgi:riboflavin kinase/FMN adenylyltransferase